MRPEASPEQRELQAAARDLLAREVDPDRLQRWENEPGGCDPALARTIAGLGWLGLGLPAESGGGGADLVDAACLVAEGARGLRPRPLLGAIRGGDALASIDSWLASPSARLLVPGDGYVRLLRSLADESQVQGNLVFDAQIAAVCLEHGATTLLTEDRDFARFRSLKPLTLEAFLGR